MQAVAPTVIVDEIIHPVVTCQAGVTTAPVKVNTPGFNSVTKFMLSNSGNGTQKFSLARTNQVGVAPNYTPLNSALYAPLNPSGVTGAIFLESPLNLTGAFAPGVDVAYVPGGNDPVVAAGAGQVIYVLSDTPSAALAARGDVLLTATSMTTGASTALINTRLVGKGQNLGSGAGNALVVTAGGASSSVCSYVIDSGLSLLKDIVSSVDAAGAPIVDPLTGLTVPPVLIAGATVTYRITATFNGVAPAMATGLVISDPLPAGVTYVPGTIAVNGITQNDALVWSAASNTVTVALGNLPVATSVVVTFKVTIN
jgi:uncharacterized repeat protein (TIGR01451 family)